MEERETPEGIWRFHDYLEPDPRIESFVVLIREARNVRVHAYAPYSKFAVGAAVRMDDQISRGCNVENASYGGTICAERSAILRGVAKGHRGLDLVAISTTSSNEEDPALRAPCGFCRQVISEFARPDALIVLDAGDSDSGKVVGDVYSFENLLPLRFRLRSS